MSFKTIEYKKINEKLYIYEHESGIKLLYVPKKGFAKKFSAFSTHFGSINNTFEIENGINKTIPDGVAHFLEHKLFEQKYGNVMGKFSELGSEPNAYTSFDKTSYLFSCVDNYYESLSLLLKYVQNPYITEESVEREKKIIWQEIQMYNDDPGWRAYSNMLEALYVNHPVKVDIAGTIDSVSKINRNILYYCYNMFYNPSNMFIFAIGDLDFYKIMEIVDKNIVVKDKKDVNLVVKEEPKNINKNFIEINMDISIPLFQIGIKESDFPRIGIQSAIYETAINILIQMIFGKSSDLYKKMYENGLINNSFKASFSVEETFSYSVFGGESREPENVMKLIKDCLKEIKRNGLKRNDFERIKKSSYGKLVKYLNSVETIASSFISNYYRNIYLFDYYSLYDRITYELIEEVFDKHFYSNDMVLSIVKPHLR